jgi:hypothetical protein
MGNGCVLVSVVSYILQNFEEMLLCLNIINCERNFLLGFASTYSGKSFSCSCGFRTRFAGEETDEW